MERQAAIETCRQYGYRVTKPRQRKEGETTNPFGHPVTHAKLRNVSLTSITRLRALYGNAMRLIANDDARNYSISGAKSNDTGASAISASPQSGALLCAGGRGEAVKATALQAMGDRPQGDHGTGRGLPRPASRTHCEGQGD